MQISRMDLADLGSPEDLVAGILQQVPDMPLPVPIEDIAHTLDIIEIKAIGSSGFEGGLITDRDKSQGVILVNRKSMYRRQRFTVGHELGHFLMPFHLPSKGTRFMCTSEDMKKSNPSKTMGWAMRMEVEANCFAAHMLMPTEPFRRELDQSETPDLNLLIRLSCKFDTSKQATARRLCDLIDIPTAVVFSKDRRVLYSVRSREFPFIPLRRGDAVPMGSVTACFSGSQGKISDMENVDGESWVDARPYCDRQLLEQTHIQTDGYCMTLLQIDEGAIEEAQEEEDLIEVYTPRFRRR